MLVNDENDLDKFEMKKYFLLILLIGCKVTQPVKKVVANKTKGVMCVLPLLPKTQDYQNQVKKYLEIYQDTIFEVESKVYGIREYKTILDIQTDKYYLWLLDISEKSIDSLLIHCIAPTKSVDTYFDVEHCKMEIETNEFDEIGNPTFGTMEIIEIRSASE